MITLVNAPTLSAAQRLLVVTAPVSPRWIPYVARLDGWDADALFTRTFLGPRGTVEEDLQMVAVPLGGIHAGDLLELRDERGVTYAEWMRGDRPAWRTRHEMFLLMGIRHGPPPADLAFGVSDAEDRPALGRRIILDDTAQT